MRWKVEVRDRQRHFEVVHRGYTPSFGSSRFRNSGGDDVRHVKTARWLWDVVTDANDVIIPGRGKLFGLGKRDWIQPWDAIPFVGPLNKANKARKFAKSDRATMYVIAGLGFAADLFAVDKAVDWYNSRFRALAEAIEEESPSPSQSGNADEEISGGGGTKKKKSVRSRNRHPVRCRATKKSGKFRGQCVRRKGHSGSHFYK